MTQGVEWISLAETARVLGISPASVMRLANNSRIGTYQVPGLRRKKYSRADAERLSREGVTQAKREPALTAVQN